MTRQAAQPEKIVVGRQDLADFLDVINTLPQHRAQIFLLARVDGMPYAQIAKAFNVSMRRVEDGERACLLSLVAAQARNLVMDMHG